MCLPVISKSRCSNPSASAAPMPGHLSSRAAIWSCSCAVRVAQRVMSTMRAQRNVSRGAPRAMPAHVHVTPTFSLPLAACTPHGPERTISSSSTISSSHSSIACARGSARPVGFFCKLVASRGASVSNASPSPPRLPAPLFPALDSAGSRKRQKFATPAHREGRTTVAPQAADQGPRNKTSYA
eukprot:359913-Chlamydomonas_euryale.AAC.4